MPDDSIWLNESQSNGAPAEEEEKKVEARKPGRWVTAPIEQVLRDAWGDNAYFSSAFYKMAVSEQQREQRLKPRPKKGK